MLCPSVYRNYGRKKNCWKLEGNGFKYIGIDKNERGWCEFFVSFSVTEIIFFLFIYERKTLLEKASCQQLINYGSTIITSFAV